MQRCRREEPASLPAAAIGSIDGPQCRAPWRWLEHVLAPPLHAHSTPLLACLARMTSS